MDIEADFVHLLRLLAEEQTSDAEKVMRRSLRGIARRRPDLADGANAVLESLPAGAGNLRRRTRPQLPLDDDSHLALIRSTSPAPHGQMPVWSPSVRSALESVISERSQSQELRDAGLSPTRTLLFVGPPGVGKTLAAGWLADALGTELLTLDLAAVMSSYLGKTGNNVRSVLSYALHKPSCLLIDEFDAVAKRRDDTSELGELKRLVTVLLQAVDEWPDSHLLIAATNHPDLLDPAIWRRFDRIIDFPLPTVDEIEKLIGNELDAGAWAGHGDAPTALAASLVGQSHAEVLRELQQAKKHAVLQGYSPNSAEAVRAVVEGASSRLREQPLPVRLTVARHMLAGGASQREVASMTGVARDTLRRDLKSEVGVE